MISVWRNTGTVNDYGERTDAWSCVGQYRANKMVQNARRALNSGEIWYPRAAVFKTRLGADVQEGDRLFHQDKYWDVISVTTDEHVDRSITINTELHND